MVKRPLDIQEKEYTEKGIIRIEKENKEIEEQLEFNRLTIEFQKTQAEYQNATRPFLMKKKEQEDKKVMEALREQKARNEATLENLRSQLEFGVTIKSIKEVKQKNGN